MDAASAPFVPKIPALESAPLPESPLAAGLSAELSARCEAPLAQVPSQPPPAALLAWLDGEHKRALHRARLGLWSGCLLCGIPTLQPHDVTTHLSGNSHTVRVDLLCGSSQGLERLSGLCRLLARKDGSAAGGSEERSWLPPSSLVFGNACLRILQIEAEARSSASASCRLCELQLTPCRDLDPLMQQAGALTGQMDDCIHQARRPLESKDHPYGSDHGRALALLSQESPVTVAARLAAVPASTPLVASAPSLPASSVSQASDLLERWNAVMMKMLARAAQEKSTACKLCDVFFYTGGKRKLDVETALNYHLKSKIHKAAVARLSTCTRAEAEMAIQNAESVWMKGLENAKSATRRVLKKVAAAAQVPVTQPLEQLSWGAPLHDTAGAGDPAAEENTAALLAALSLPPSALPHSPPLVPPLLGQPAPVAPKRAPRPYAPPGVTAVPPPLPPPGLPRPAGPPPGLMPAEAAFFAELRAMGCAEPIAATMDAGGVIAADLLRLRSLPPADADAELVLLGFSVPVQRARVRAALRAVL